MIRNIARRRNSGSVILMVVGFIGLVGAIYFAASGAADTVRKMRSAYSIMVCSVFCMLIGLISILLWFSKLNKVRSAEPYFSDELLMSCEASVDDLYFVFADRLIAMYEPRIVYFNEIYGLNITHSYGTKGRAGYRVVFNLADGSKFSCLFRYRSLANGERARMLAESLYTEIKMRCPYVV